LLDIYVILIHDARNYQYNFLQSFNKHHDACFLINISLTLHDYFRFVQHRCKANRHKSAGSIQDGINTLFACMIDIII
jgi:hypothetical protein